MSARDATLLARTGLLEQSKGNAAQGHVKHDQFDPTYRAIVGRWIKAEGDNRDIGIDRAAWVRKQEEESDKED